MSISNFSVYKFQLLRPEDVDRTLDSPVTLSGDNVEALVDLWNGEMTRVVDMITPERPFPQSRAKPSLQVCWIQAI